MTKNDLISAIAAKDSINPATKKPIHVPAKKVPAFKAGKALKEAVDK